MTDTNRRTALRLGLAAGTALAAGAAKAEVASDKWMAEGATTLKALHQRLNAAPKRRDFKSVPMVLDSEDYWDHEAIAALLAYRGGPKQIWDMKDLGGPWLNLMRNNLNVQTYSFKKPDFLIVSATHASAHLAMYDEAMWEKYQIAKLAGPAFPDNKLIVEQKAASGDPRDYKDGEGALSPADNSIPTLQRRGAVFLACHNSIWEQAEALMRNGSNPDKLSHEQLAAELTNHLIPNVVLTPGAVATLLYFEQAGFYYAT